MRLDDCTHRCEICPLVQPPPSALISWTLAVNRRVPAESIRERGAIGLFVDPSGATLGVRAAR